MRVLAIDLGAESGRAISGCIRNTRLVTEEIHRFPNDPVQVGGHLHWDILRLYHELKASILKAKQLGSISGLGIDSWAVDFGLIAPGGQLLGNPYHYRDRLSAGMMEEVLQRVPKQDIFQGTGIQFLPFNTIYQLYALKQQDSPYLKEADALLMIPDLLRYFLTGEKKSEFTNATTTQLFHPIKRDWNRELANRLGIPDRLFQPVVEPGTVIGPVQSSIVSELDLAEAFPVIAVAEHDTASAVAAVPAPDSDFAYLSCGTWSLLGTETKQPVLNEQALELNFTNEGGVKGTYRLLKNIMGLWLLQQCKRKWDRAGQEVTYPELVKEAEHAPPFKAFVDPDAHMFLNPPDMPAQIIRYCRDTNQPVPESRGEIVRCVLESLALKYRYVLERTEQLSGKRFSRLHMVGGGTRNRLLCQFTANVIGRPVWAGPVEASSIGNVAMQLIALGELSDVDEARSLIRQSFEIVVYEPDHSAQEWDEAYGKFCEQLEQNVT